MPVADAPAHHAPAQRAPVRRANARFDRVERAVLRAMNRARGRRGLARLRPARRIAFVATIHSADQAANRFLSHSSSNGTTFDRRIRSAVRARTVGETIIELRGRTTGRRIVRAWLASPPHRREVLSPVYRRVGIGRASASGLNVVTADFASGR